LSSRNLQKTKVITLSELNTYEIMNASAVLFIESSLDVLQKNA
jgi:large subunit ribosomal protein L4